jgi:hypothetical protein
MVEVAGGMSIGIAEAGMVWVLVGVLEGMAVVDSVDVGTTGTHTVAVEVDVLVSVDIGEAVRDAVGVLVLVAVFLMVGVLEPQIQVAYCMVLVGRSVWDGVQVNVGVEVSVKVHVEVIVVVADGVNVSVFSTGWKGVAERNSVITKGWNGVGVAGPGTTNAGSSTGFPGVVGM